MKHQSNSRTTSGAGSSLKQWRQVKTIIVALSLTASFVMSGYAHRTFAGEDPRGSRLSRVINMLRSQKFSTARRDEATNPVATEDPSSKGGRSVTSDQLALSTPLVEVQKLIARDGASRDFFGDTVAISGDTAIVGSPFDNVGTHVRQGSAVVFVRSGNAWVEQQKILANDGVENDEFGSSVAVSGDTVVVGAVATTLGVNPSPGSAYVFVRSGGVWTQQQKLAAADGAADDHFGNSVAISGDRVLVGAPDHSVAGAIHQGAVYAFARFGNIWLQQQEITASDGHLDEVFGADLAIDNSTAVIKGGDRGGPDGFRGAAYVFALSGGLWFEQQKLTADDSGVGDDFGGSLALSGDTLVVGAAFDDIGASLSQGSVYVFIRTGSTWTLQQKLLASDGAIFDDLGFDVAISGDTIIAGAPGKALPPIEEAGAAFVFSRAGTVWTEQQKLTASDAGEADGLGAGVAISDVVIIGAPGHKVGSNDVQGAAYVFSVPPAFDLCIQDDLSAKLLRLNSKTGDYEFIDCRNGFRLSGKGSITVNACKIQLTDSGTDPKHPDHLVSALVNTCTKVASATVQTFLPVKKAVSISDPNITNNTCACQ